MSLIPRIPGAIRRLGELARLSKNDIGVPLRGHIDGYIQSNHTDTAHDISFSAGQASDENNLRYITRDSALVKQIDAAYTVGASQGGLATALTLTASTWYHTHVLGFDANPAQVDGGFDTSLTATNLLLSASGALARRTGSVKTDGSSNIRQFVQVRDMFLWGDPPLDFDANVGTTAALIDLSVPPGLKVWALLTVTTTGGGIKYFSSPDIDDEAPSSTAAPLYHTAVTTTAVQDIVVLTNTASQIRARSSVSENVKIVTRGWIDPRGQE